MLLDALVIRGKSKQNQLVTVHVVKLVKTGIHVIYFWFLVLEAVCEV